MKYTNCYYLLSNQLLIIMSTSPTYIAIVAPYYVCECILYTTHNLRSSSCRWSNFTILFMTRYQHHGDQTWLVMLLCTIVCAPLWDGCATMVKSKTSMWVLTKTLLLLLLWHALLCDIRRWLDSVLIPVWRVPNKQSRSILSPLNFLSPSILHSSSTAFVTASFSRYVAVAETLQCIWDPPICSGSFVLCTILAAWQ